MVNKFEIEVLYEDNHIIVVKKPQNIPSQADSSNDDDMLSLVKNYIKEKYKKEGNVFVGLVHRLDRPTGGVMVFAKTSKAASRLSEQIRDKAFEKKYLAVVVGKPRLETAVLKNYLKKDEKTNIVTIAPQSEEGSKEAVLEYKLLSHKNPVSLLEVKIHTGRSHQIRVQLSSIGTPIFGDVKYKGDALAKGHNLALWAFELCFEHPTLKKSMKFKCYPPKDQVPFSSFFEEILKI